MFRLYAITLGLLLGIGLLSESYYLAKTAFPFLILISLITLILYHPRFKLFRWCADFILALILGYSWSYCQVAQVKSWSLPEQTIGQVSTLKGKVTHLPQQFSSSLQFDFRLESICDVSNVCVSQDGLIRLNWQQPTQHLEPGQLLTLTARLKSPLSLANPGTRNQKKAYFLSKIRAVGSVQKLILSTSRQNQAGVIDRFRQICLDKIAPAIESLPYGKILEALTLGVRQKFTQSDWVVFQKTGTSHLMAISGLHVGLFASLFWWMGSRIWRLSFRATSRVPAQLIGGGIGLIAALLYSMLAGFSIPTQRALIMITVVVLANTLKRPLSFGQVLCIAILAIATWDVLALYSEGFWLSVVAVFFLLALSQNPVRFASIKLQYALLIAMLPLTLFFFSQFSLISPLSNFFAIPIVGWGVVPLALLGLALSFVSATLGSSCLYLADRIFAGVWFFLEKMAGWPFFYEISITPLQFILLAIGCALFLLPKGMPWRFIGVLGFLPILLNQAPRPKEGEAWFYLFDIGQGLASVVQTRHHTLLFDAGPTYGSTDAGERILWPFFRQKRIKTIDQVILSHTDNDHIGGFESITKHMTIQNLLSSEPDRFKGAWQSAACERGQNWVWEGVHFEILHPDNDFTGKKNERSCVLRVTVGTHTLLLSGDIEKQAEAKLLKYDRLKLQSDILVVPHHGSLTSSTVAFVEAVFPRYALMAVGSNNRYGLPKAAVVDRYQTVGSEVLLTHQTGAIWFKLVPDQIIEDPVLWRQKQNMIWD